jgi:tetraacyldisaccharide 4'-kinase
MKRPNSPRPLLWPLVPVYRIGLAVREFQLRTGIKPICRLRWPVISIGNLSTGGSGKTPLTITLAKALAARGIEVDVLSRGYGRRPNALPLLVDPSGTAEEFGDEPLLIAREAQIPVYVAADRYQAGLMAEARAPQSADGSHNSKAHLLDDGFQHRQLARDIDILLLSQHDLSGHLLPAGNLREALHATARADVIAVPADEPSVVDWLKSRSSLNSRSWTGETWCLRRSMDVPVIEGTVAAFCGIARPGQFFDGLETAGLRLASRIAFPDHHRYTVTDLNRIVAEARKTGASTLMTTEKDCVRLGSLADSLPESLPLKTTQLRIEIENESAAIDWLVNQVEPAR